MSTPHDPTDPTDASRDEPAVRAGEPDTGTEERLDPDREAALRRLLAEAGGPEGLPADVAARLEATLADLVAERTAGTDGPATDDRLASASGAPVVLASRRRRRVLQVMVAAAAVAVVVGIGFQWASDEPDGDMMSAIADGEPDRGTDPADSQALDDPEASTQDGLDAELDARSGVEGSDDDAAMPTRVQGPRLSRSRRNIVDEPLTVVRPRRLREDLMELRAAQLPDPATADYSGVVLTAPRDFTCADMRPGPGVLVGVRYQRNPAVVAFREPVGSMQVAEVLQCGTGEVLRSVTLAAPG